MVRIMVGTLLDVGYGKIPLNDINKIIESKDRKMAGHTAKAMGLCLMRVDY
jgi:tRNA pseudouridine38-40 synthase